MLSAVERTWPWWAEVLLLFGVGVLSVQEAYVGAGGTLASPQVALAAVAGLSLAVCHRWPVAVSACTVAVAAFLGIALPLMVVLFHLAYVGHVAVAVACAVCAMAGNLVLQEQQGLWTTRSYGPLLLPVAVLALGLWMGGRRRLVASLDRQVEQLRVERELRAEQARLGERARIAAEMHDVLAHRLSVLALHAGALQRRAAVLPAPVADRVDLLRTTSTEALRDLRDVLGVLRDSEPDGEHGTRSPGPRDLPTLLHEARTAGQRIDAVVEGDVTAVPVSHRLAVHRVVREVLTNARKHASGAAVRVVVRYGPPTSAIEVSNEAGTRAGLAEVDSGYGLAGLTERVASLGGRLEYGPTEPGG